MHNDIKPVLVKLKPYDNESLSGFICRLSIANYVDLQTFLSYVGLSKYEDLSYKLDDTKLVEALSIISGISIETLIKMTPAYQRQLLKSKVDNNDVQKFVRNFYIIQRGKAFFCPRCLKEKRFYRLNWLFQNKSICHIHNIKLIDRCEDCSNKLSIEEVQSGVCKKCNRRLDEMHGDRTIYRMIEYERLIECLESSIKPLKISAIIKQVQYFNLFSKLNKELLYEALDFDDRLTELEKFYIFYLNPRYILFEASKYVMENFIINKEFLYGKIKINNKYYECHRVAPLMGYALLGIELEDIRSLGLIDKRKFHEIVHSYNLKFLRSKIPIKYIKEEYFYKIIGTQCYELCKQLLHSQLKITSREDFSFEKLSVNNQEKIESIVFPELSEYLGGIDEGICKRNEFQPILYEYSILRIYRAISREFSINAHIIKASICGINFGIDSNMDFLSKERFSFWISDSDIHGILSKNYIFKLNPLNNNALVIPKNCKSMLRNLYI